MQKEKRQGSRLPLPLFITRMQIHRIPYPKPLQKSLRGGIISYLLKSQRTRSEAQHAKFDFHPRGADQ